VTSFPTWAVWTLAFATPVLAFAGGLTGQVVTRLGAKELEQRSKREEVMRILRWAAELGVSSDEARVRLGRAELETLLDADLLDEEERDFVQTALEATLEERAEQLSQPDAQAIMPSSLATGEEADIPSTGQAVDEEGGN
jgi:hypothetical protein